MIQTHRGYEEPFVRQIAIFLQNKVGELGDLLRTLAQVKVSVLALSVTDSVDFAVVRMIVDRADPAIAVLREANLPVSESEIIAVELPGDGDDLLDVCRALLSAEINTHYMYCMLARPQGNSVVLVHADDPTLAVEVLVHRGYRLLGQLDLLDPTSGGGADESWA